MPKTDGRAEYGKRFHQLRVLVLDGVLTWMKMSNFSSLVFM